MAASSHLVEHAPSRRRFGVVLATLGLLLGCAQTQVKSRDILRRGPLRDAPLQAHLKAGPPARVDAGTNALTDEELARVEASVNASFATHIAAHPPRAGDGVALEAALLDCVLDAGPGQRHTVYQARCRAALFAGPAEVVLVEATAVRKERSSAVTQDDIDALKENPRDPVLKEGSSEAALLAAVEALSARLLNVAELSDEERTRLSRNKDIAAAARRRAAGNPEGEAARMAIAADLSRHGRAEDSDVLLPWAADVRRGPRMALAVALAELCSASSRTVLQRMRIDIDPRVREAAERGLTCIDALHPGESPAGAG